MTKPVSGSVVYVAPGVYRVHWGHGRDDRGKRQRQSKVIHGTRKDAEAFLARQAAGGYRVAKAVTWSAFFDACVRPTFDGLAAKTVQEYERQWRHDLEPRIGAKRVRDTDWRMVNDVLATIESPTVQRHAFALWRKSCNLAVLEGLLSANPCTRATQLKPYRKPQPPIVTDVAEFMEAINGIKYEAAMLVMLGGGLRVEEACGLTWGDLKPCLHRGSHYVHAEVKRAVTTAYNRPVTKETKTASSTRTVVIGEPFASRLEALRGEHDAPLVGCAPTTMTHNWRDWCRRHGVEYVRPKDMRASYATLCGEAGCIDSLVAMQMGHTDGTTKGRNYQRQTIAGGRLVADTLTDYLAHEMAHETA